MVDASSIVCVIVTPLGFPVDPDVHRISTGASGSAGDRAASAARASGGATSGRSSRSITGSATSRGMVTGSTVLPVPSRIADGSVSAAMRSIVSAVIRTSSGTRTTFARPAANRAAANPGPGAPWTRIRAPGSTAAANRAAAFPTATPNSAIVSETERVLEVRTPRKGASPELATASSSSSDRVRGSAFAAGGRARAASRRGAAATWAGRCGQPRWRSGRGSIAPSRTVRLGWAVVQRRRRETREEDGVEWRDLEKNCAGLRVLA